MRSGAETQRWLSCRQCDLEGGFNGRTNKLVDGCYSWYVGASMVMVSRLREVGVREECE